MRSKAYVLGSILLLLAGCEQLTPDSLFSSSDDSAAEDVSEVDGTELQPMVALPLPESEGEPLGSVPPPPGPPPRKPLFGIYEPPVGIGDLPTKSDHEGFETLRSYEAVKLTEDNLIGIEPVDAMGLLGVPEQIREDPPAQVWAYQRGGCSLEIYFYLDLESDNLRSLTYELDAGEPSEAARQACLTRLLTPEGDHG